MSEEILKAQVLSAGQEILAPVLPATYATYRTIRKYPTLALARSVAAAPILAGTWSVEGDDADRVDFIRDNIVPLRSQIVRHAIFGGIDFGWQGFEKVFDVKNGRQIIKKIKPLLQDITTILVDENTGAFAKFKQGEIELPTEYCLLFYFREEGSNWYGESLLENARGVYNKWVVIEEGAALYDTKVAGSHWVVKYPLGTSVDADGADKDNAELAKELVDSLKASGSVIVPNVIAQYAMDLNKQIPGWEISLIGGETGHSPEFTARQEYMDKLMVRALLRPERSILEGEHGTKAEAGYHGDIGLQNSELDHNAIVQIVNWHLVDQLLALNWGEEARGTVHINAVPLTDDEKVFYRAMYEKILSNPTGFMQEYEEINTAVVREKLDIPSKLEPLPKIAEVKLDADADLTT